MRYITHSKYRNWSKCDVRRILNCDIYRIYFLNAMYVASACGVLICVRFVFFHLSPEYNSKLIG